MNIIISNSKSDPIYEQIVSQIKAAIAKGELKEGDSLPSMRNLAADLRISVITTKRAYEELERQGYIDSFTGKGSFIKKQNDELSKEEALKQIESYLIAAVERAKSNQIDCEELKQLISILYNE